LFSHLTTIVVVVHFLLLSCCLSLAHCVNLLCETTSYKAEDKNQEDTAQCEDGYLQVSEFVRNLASKSFPIFKQQIFSVFSNDSSTFLPLATDTVKKLQVSANLILLGTIQKMEQAAAKLTDLKIPILTLSSILLILVLCLVGSCFAKQVDTMRQRKATRKQKEMDDYYNRRQMREQLNSTPAYEALQIE
jgi:flagellar basal body-associated protein FliL